VAVGSRSRPGTSEEAERTHPTDNVIVICKVSLAFLAAEDLVGGQVDVVRETHGGWWRCPKTGKLGLAVDGTEKVQRG
jgi:hypothetical protein